MSDQTDGQKLDKQFRRYNRFAARPGSINSNRYFDVHPPVFWVAAILTILFIIVTLWMGGGRMSEVFESTQNAISNSMGWVFILAVNFFFIFILYLGFSRYGRIRLGGKNTKPEFTRTAWFAMLFSAGMGIGIIFWGVAEPMSHYLHPPGGEAQTQETAQTAMDYTFLHWGLHAWGVYALVALALAFFRFNRRLPLSIRGVFYPLFGKRVYGMAGDIIDVLAVFSTLFGLATSLGIGVKQINAGLDYLVGLNQGLLPQILLITGITIVATLSVVSGINKGVKFLSEQNIRMGALLMLFVLLMGPTIFIFHSLVQNIGSYLSSLVEIGFWAESYQQTNWQNNWTVFYWSWWIAWSPFVGTFIARVSKGRTIREFVAGVLLVPSILTFMWLTTFGGSALYIELFGSGGIAKASEQNVATALFVLLQKFPLEILSSTIGVLLIASFFITSSDSGSLVIDSLTSGGKTNAPVYQRIFWAVVVGAVAAVLLIGGGLKALQTAVITTGLPFALILLLMCYSLYRGLQREYAEIKAREKRQEQRSYIRLLERLVDEQIDEK